MTQAALRFSLAPVDHPEEVGGRWRDLESRADASFFLSWPWTAGVLGQMPDRSSPRLLTIHSGGSLAGLGLFARRPGRRLGLLPVGRLHLQHTGDPACDAVAVEHNGLLVDRRAAGAVEAAVLRWLVGQDGWDELVLPGVAPDWAAAAKAAGLSVRVLVRHPLRWVDLEAIRRAGGDPLTVLSRNTRQQLRRALRAAEAYGPLVLDEAASAGEAHAFFDGLKRLHVAQWRRRGRPHAFTHTHFERFHRDLIDRCFGDGAVQMLRLRAGGEEVGYLYNFRHRGRVMAYQSGFAFTGDPRGKPGMVAHHLAIRRNLEAGERVYDFLAGDNQMKAVLANRADEMLWLVARRDGFGRRLEDALRSLKRLIHKR